VLFPLCINLVSKIVFFLWTRTLNNNILSVEELPVQNIPTINHSCQQDQSSMLHACCNLSRHWDSWCQKLI